jgi:hypothetical protein
MHIHQEASGPLFDLLNTYEDPQRYARKAHAAGSVVVGRIGVGIPEELILASCAVATMLTPDSTAETLVADAMMDPGEQPELRSLLDQIASPDANFLSLVVLGPPYSGLSATIEDLRRAELLPDAAPTSYFELPATGDAKALYAEARIRDLAARLGAVTGRPATQATLQTSIAATNRRREALRNFMAARRDGMAISGRDAMRAIGAASFLPADTFTPALKALTASPPPDAALQDRPRILLAPSSPLVHDRAHAAIEGAGGLIIAEDDPLAARAAEQNIAETGDPISAITQHYLQNMTGARVFPAAARLKWFHAEAIKPDVDAVIFYGEEPRYGWDYPAMREYLDAHGKPSAFIRADARLPDGQARLRSQAETFLTGLATRRHGVGA